MYRFFVSLGAILLALTSCAPADDTQLKVHNGEVVYDPAGPVQLLEGGCSGTFVAPRVYVTAAHCSGNRVFSHDQRFYLNLVDCRVSPDFDAAASLVVTSDHDWRVCLTDGEASQIGVRTLMPLSSTPLKAGDKISFFGFGNSDIPTNSGSGVLRRGFGQVDSVEKHELVAKLGSLKSGQATASGDSGGPWLNAKGEMVGIVKSGTMASVAAALDMAYFHATPVTDPGFPDAVENFKRMTGAAPGSIAQEYHLSAADVEILVQQVSASIAQFPPGAISCEVLRNQLLKILREKYPAWNQNDEGFFNQALRRVNC